jgi:hypothetical protein
MDGADEDDGGIYEEILAISHVPFNDRFDMLDTYLHPEYTRMPVPYTALNTPELVAQFKEWFNKAMEQKSKYILGLFE